MDQTFPAETSTGLSTVSPTLYHTIVLPTRPQPDTIIAIFLLRTFGEAFFPDIGTAKVAVWQHLPPTETEQTILAKGVVLIDIGGGRFDHHHRSVKTTASRLIAEYFGIHEDPALKKLLLFAERDDFYGKGTISSDPLDRAFGFSGLVASLNKQYVEYPDYVAEVAIPFIAAHYHEQMQQHHYLPHEFADKLARGEVHTFTVKQEKKNLKIVVLESEHRSFPGYLRSQGGGAYDVVAQRLPSGHLNILTRPTKHVDLRCLAALLRIKELTLQNLQPTLPLLHYAAEGKIKSVPQWYYDPATNSIQNGGVNPLETMPTRITKEELIKILEVGLSKAPWAKISGETEGYNPNVKAKPVIDDDDPLAEKDPGR